MLLASGEPAQAAELLLGALELAPQWAAGWFRLGEMQEAARFPDQAAQAWAMALKLDPADRLGSALKSPGRFRLALDLGCGTGLMGERLRPIVDRLEGYDISSSMLRKARAKGIYDKLSKSDLQHFSRPGSKADLVVAADVFIYVGALERIVGAVADSLVDEGLFAFSVETLAGGDDFALLPSRRYAHSVAYVRRVLADSGFAILSLESTTIRHDRGEPVGGLAVIARRKPAE
ncbi:MAG: methyltransferase domain-containing protein [Mesorhizobium sp.]|nr:MAG: methyltransferase domain-containing protein [Mesorhizobium sp.]